MAGCRSRPRILLTCSTILAALAAALLTSAPSAHAQAITEFPVDAGLTTAPLRITTGADTSLWFTENFGDKIGRITTSGAITEYLVPTANSFPFGITRGDDGALWFTESTAGKIGRITTSGAISEFALPSPNSRPGYITRGPHQAIWFAETGSNAIGRLGLA